MYTPLSEYSPTFPVYVEVKSDSVKGGGDDIEVGERGLYGQVLLGTGQSRKFQLHHNVSLLLRLKVSHGNVTGLVRSGPIDGSVSVDLGHTVATL